MNRSSIFVEKATEPDAQEAMEWFLKTECNLLDAEIFTYPVTETLKAVRDKKALVYLPRQTAYVLESLAISPHNSPIDTAAALAELIKVVRWEAHKAGHGEIYMGCKEESTQAYAERHGFEKVSFPMYRMKVR